MFGNWRMVISAALLAVALPQLASAAPVHGDALKAAAETLVTVESTQYYGRRYGYRPYRHYGYHRPYRRYGYRYYPRRHYGYGGYYRRPYGYYGYRRPYRWGGPYIGLGFGFGF
jgi:hypothetical protein